MWTDTHAHLDMEEFEKDRDLVIQRAKEQQVEHIITVGVDLESSRKAVQLAKTYTAVHAAIGIHPHEAKGFTEKSIDPIVALSDNDEVVAWGEIGLDFYKRYSPQVDQKKAFEAQLQVALDLKLPVIIHDRDAHGEVLGILKRLGKRDRFGVVHCYSGDMALASELFALGFFISVSGTISYKKAGVIREVASKAPLDRLLIETDCPFLAPTPHRGHRNEPAFVAITGRELARLRGMSEAKLAEATTTNAKYLFKI